MDEAYIDDAFKLTTLMVEALTLDIYTLSVTLSKPLLEVNNIRLVETGIS
jgi:hypothetical protein